MSNAKDESLLSIYRSFLNIYVLLDDGDRRTLQAENLTPSQFNLLTHLEHETIGLTLTDLAKRLLCTRGNVTRMVQRLDKLKLIHIKQDNADQRRLRITLTTTGKESLQSAFASHTTSLQQRFATLSSTQQAQLIELLQQVTANLETDLS
ncbi:MAG: MarR family transcriptional regulator [Chloroflexi bacterium]|nr:MAG: MarR family transcriptional regulator [Chloroflexota bacterium]